MTLQRLFAGAAVFVGSYLFVFFGTWVSILLWTEVAITNDMLTHIAVKSSLFAPPIGLIFLAALRRRNKSTSSKL
jgi:hypothetical protein